MTELMLAPTAASEPIEIGSALQQVSTQTAPAAESVPPSIPRDQLYYWSHQWQDDEAESLRELEEGQGREFGSAAEALRWLFDPSD